jgi:hypothetical protein
VATAVAGPQQLQEHHRDLLNQILVVMLVLLQELVVLIVLVVVAAALVGLVETPIILWVHQHYLVDLAALDCSIRNLLEL